jgi:hypothetical protein
VTEPGPGRPTTDCGGRQPPLSYGDSTVPRPAYRGLWVSDGTDAGTTLVADIAPGWSNGAFYPLYGPEFNPVGDLLFFVGTGSAIER